MPKQHLDGYYMMEKYMQAYEPQVRAMLRPEEWPYVDRCDEILPPIAKVQLRRPRKVRRRAPDEPTNPYKISCSGYVVICGNYGGLGSQLQGLPSTP
jgi:hypothetical protein